MNCTVKKNRVINRVVQEKRGKNRERRGMNIHDMKIQGMTYREREELKGFAVACEMRGDVQSLTRTLVMIAHWMRQGRRVSFTEYASQWTEAQRERDDGNHSTPEMVAQWPFTGKRCIYRGGSHYFPSGVDSLSCDAETAIRHAVTVVLAEYPDFNQGGLSLYQKHTVWEHPLRSPDFLAQSVICLDWLKSRGLTDCQTVKFSGKNTTSYGLRHHIEWINRASRRNAPGEIGNGAVIAAMVAAGYRIKPTGRMNCRFNISYGKLSRVIREDLQAYT